MPERRSCWRIGEGVVAGLGKWFRVGTFGGWWRVVEGEDFC